MNTKIINLTTILLILTLFSCDNEVELSLPLTDCWTEIEHETILQFAGTNHIFCFLSDAEFTLELQSWTDAIGDINAPNPWTEYIKGTYVFSSDSFEIKGSYMDSVFINSVTNSSGETEYARTYEVKVVSETEIILNNNDDNPTREIRLLK